MNRINSYLENLDFKQKFMIYFILFAFLGYLFYYLMTPVLTQREELQANITDLQSKIEKNLTKNLKIRIKKQEKEMLKLNSDYEAKKEEINYLLSGLYKLKYAFYDKKEWAKSIDDILRNSLRRNIKINYIKSIDLLDANSSNLLKRKKTIEIAGSGKYIDIVAFVSYIDNLNMLLKFTKTEIKEDGEYLNFILSLDMYGIGL